LISGGDILRVGCSLYGQCRFAMVAMAFNQHSFKFPMLCCDLYEEIKMAAIYIYISYLAFSWGRNPYLGCDAFLGVSIFLLYWTPHLSCGWIA